MNWFQTSPYLHKPNTDMLICVSIIMLAQAWAQNDTVPVTVYITPQPTIRPEKYSTDKPNKMEWVRGYRPEDKVQLLEWLIGGCWPASMCPSHGVNTNTTFVEYEGYDGFYNNPAHPELGAVDTPLLRRVPAAYEDGVYKPSGRNRPEPLDLSEKILRQEAIGTRSNTGKTALLVFFGQQVVEEILDAQRPACPPEYFNVKVPDNHTYRHKPGHTMMPVLRTRYDMRTGFSPNNPRQQLNEITPWLDGGLVYGTTKTWADQLRRYKNGTTDPNGLLATTPDGLFPEINAAKLPMANPPPPFYHADFKDLHEIHKVSRFNKLGNPRGNENAFLLTFGVLWFRWHNHIARYLKDHTDWSGEKIFNEARKWVIASHQHIVVNEWLPLWLGKELPPYNGYNPSIDPQIDQFFQSAAFRFGHTLVPPGVYLRDYGRNGCNVSLPGWNSRAVRTCNIFWRPQDVILARYNGTKEHMDIDRLLMGMALQMSEKEDHTIVEDLRGKVFGPLEFSRRDLMALNIQRGRDHGLPDYNTNVEKAFKELHDKTKNYFDDVDLWVGGILETVDDGPGELFTAIIEDQFTRIRDGDRFWYKNRANNLFTDKEIERLERLTIYDIIMSVTKMDHDDIQEKPFAAPFSSTEVNPNCDKILVKALCTKTNRTTKEKTITQCLHLEQLNATHVESCTDAGTYDYFTNSELSFILTFLGVGFAIFVFVGALFLMIRVKHVQQKEKMLMIASRVRDSFHKEKKHLIPYSVREWVNRKAPYRDIVIVMNPEKRQIQVRDQRGHLLRAMDLSNSNIVEMYIITDGVHLMLKVSNDYDLVRDTCLFRVAKKKVLKFNSEYLRDNFLKGFEEFITHMGVARNRINVALAPALKQAITREDRQKKLEMFFRVVFSQAFKISHSEDEILKLDSHAAREVIYTELTKSEFAEALSMRPESGFVQKVKKKNYDMHRRNMFSLVDKDKNGFISFREFVDMLVIFAKGSADDKAKLMFDMYDINKTGILTKEDFKNMIKSLMETVNADVEQQDLDKVINDMMRQAGLSNKDAMGVDDFQRLLLDYKDKLSYTQLSFSGVPGQQSMQKTSKRHSFQEITRQTVYKLYGDPSEAAPSHHPLKNEISIDEDQAVALENSKLQPVKTTPWLAVRRIIENYSREIFWVTLYTLVLLAIFAERAYYYSVEREHSGLRRIAGYGVTVTRGAASAMMFTYSSLLLTMCRNIITIMRDTFLHVYIPFDGAVSFHKYIAIWSLVFTARFSLSTPGRDSNSDLVIIYWECDTLYHSTIEAVVHIIGHGFNFYSISTQTSDDLSCLFRNFHHATHEIPKFHYWCWQTITGVTGILLTLLTALIFVFSLPVARQRLYNAFWITHSLYPLFYILMVLHGTGRLIQEPFFVYFFIGPCTLFIVDRMITVSTKKVEVPVVNAELLPSNVTMLEFKRPHNFEYKSGQWVRIACPTLNTSEYHPFTLSSSPNEASLTVHIRAVGPWTTNIRNLYDPSLLRDKPLPKIHVEGPYGEGHQDWYQFEVSVLIGGGIGVTPFASILKDIVFRANSNASNCGTSCKKVYFLWVTKTQKQFEWLVDIVRDLEIADTKRVMSVHIFISQFYQKFDLRTILLRVCDRSLLTGLRAVTHFGRPNFLQFFKSLQAVNPRVRKVGVFSCGPPPMTQMVDKTCVNLNKETVKGPIFQHHFKNF
uniref:NAD(P)H oxidase (H2O2-forming) n=1 Tax=Timema poppense TaxID=170557 RepID=A0A7R9CTR0_TIMPO|nr:unnamed protein product [Timema poppensis]